MSFGTGAGVRASYVIEATPGVTPTTPAFKNMRVTRSTMKETKITEISNERQADRNVRQEMLLGFEAGGAYDFELSYGSFDDILAGVFYNDWATNVLKNGVAPKYFTFEETIELGVTDSYQRYPMSVISSLSLDITARQKVTGNFNVMSKERTLGTAAIAGATYTASNTNLISSASASISAISLTGITPLPKIRRISLSLSNNLRRGVEVGSLYTFNYGADLFDVTGTVEAYMNDNTLAQATKDHATGALQFTIGTVTNEKYTILIPKLRWMADNSETGGRQDDIINQVSFRGEYDTTEACSVKITRAVV